MQPKFDTGAEENLRRAALWPPLVYNIEIRRFSNIVSKSDKEL